MVAPHQLSFSPPPSFVCPSRHLHQVELTNTHDDASENSASTPQPTPIPQTISLSTPLRTSKNIQPLENESCFVSIQETGSVVQWSRLIVVVSYSINSPMQPVFDSRRSHQPYQTALPDIFWGLLIFRFCSRILCLEG